MPLASGIPIKTILINQSLGDGSNLKAGSSLNMGQGSTPSLLRAEARQPIRYLFIMAAKDT